jgi:hypothetical protein
MNWVQVAKDNTIQADLIITPRVDKRFNFNEVAPYVLYQELDDIHMLIPRFATTPHHPSTHPHIFPSIDVAFNGQLRDNQIEPYRQAIHHLSTYGGGL